MSVDAVLSYHTNPQTCGVAKFNHALAKRLGVRFGSVNPRDAAFPLFSVKCSEIPQTRGRLHPPYALFLHDSPASARDWEWVHAADRVYAANPAIAADVQGQRKDVITAFCPSTVEGNPDRGGYRVLTFGMSHKLVLPHFEQLKRDLERDHPDYTISLSTAVHEGNPWDEALTSSVEAMRSIFGDRLRVLGFLADDALARELHECDAVAAFFVPAFRANNTSAWAALSAGKFLYTNLDTQSPALDPEAYGWDALLKVLA
jgi:hypothetical protein